MMRFSLSRQNNGLGWVVLRRVLLAAIVLASLLSRGAAAWAAEPIALDPALVHANLSGALEYLEDPGQSLRLEQVRALPAARFRPLDKKNFSVGFSASAFWIRARLVNPGTEPVEWVIKHHFPFTDFVEYTVVVDGKLVTAATGGDRTSLSERQVAYRYPAMRHTSAPGEQAELYIRLRNDQSAYVLLLFSLTSGRAFLQEVASDHMLLGALYGMPLALAFMALIGWAITRDRRFGTYAFYALSVLGSWLGLNGLLGEYLFVDLPSLANDCLHIFFLLAILFSAMFSRDFLRTRELLPRVDHCFRFLIAASAACIVLRLAGVYTLVTQATFVLMVLDAATPLAGWLALRRGVSYARWYLVAQLLYSTMIVVGIGIAYLTGYTYGGFIYAEVAFFGQLLLLSVAQYDRIRVQQRDKEMTEQGYKAELEVQVAERTRDLEEAREWADRASRSKSEFLANMSHEIRTPINAIAGFATLAQRTALNPRQADYVAKIHAATQSLSSIVNDLLDFSKMETGHIEMDVIGFRLDEVLAATDAYVRPLAERKGLQWLVDRAPGIPAVLDGDPMRLGQVLGNLCGNAMKFTERGEVDLRVKPLAEADGRIRLLFTIRDTGIGLSADQAAKLFQPFSQADTSTTRKFGGTGLGLVISQRLAGMMHGRIWLESVQGAGATFYFEAEFGCGRATDALATAAASVGLPFTPDGSSDGTRPALEHLLHRFNEALATVNAEIQPVQGTQLASRSQPEHGVVLTVEMRALLDELRACLQQNDTRADDLVKALHHAAGGQATALLQQIDAAVSALEYETALRLTSELASRPVQ